MKKSVNILKLTLGMFILQTIIVLITTIVTSSYDIKIDGIEKEIYSAQK